MQPLCIYSFCSLEFSVWGTLDLQRDLQRRTRPPLTHCISAIQVQKERAVPVLFVWMRCWHRDWGGVNGHQHALAHPGTMDILTFTDSSLLFLFELLYENRNGGATGRQSHFIIAKVFYQSWRWLDLHFLEYAAGVRSTLFRETFSHHCWRSCQPCAPTLLPPTLESSTNTRWALLPLHPVCQFWPAFQWLNAKIHGCNIFKGLSHLSHSGCLCCPSSWVDFKTSTTYITEIKTCSLYTFSFITYLWVDFSLAMCFPGPWVLPELGANQPNQWDLSASEKFRGAGCTKPHCSVFCWSPHIIALQKLMVLMA